MNEKEKAKSIFDKYATYVVMWSGGAEVAKENCKQCALIAVDEILSNTMDGYYYIGYWNEVKKEIEAL